MAVTGEDDWEAVWDARADALAEVLGPGYDEFFHARHPFAFGGQADLERLKRHGVYPFTDLTRDSVPLDV